MTGGVVYRGAEYPELDGEYLFSDFCNTSIRALAGASGNPVAREVLPANVVAAPSAFGTDADGEVYVASLYSGIIYRLRSADADSDGVGDSQDNCIEQPNGPLIPDAGGNSQLDTDGDNIGNKCDCDFTQDNVCGFPDFNLLIGCYGRATGGDPTCLAADMNGDGFVGFPDFNDFIGLYGGPPGPSGLVP